MTTRCAVEPHTLPLSLFDERYRSQRRPVLLLNATASAAHLFSATVHPDALRAEPRYAAATITLSSANAHSYGRRRTTLAHYLATMANADWRAPADSLWYWFGEHGDELRALLDSYPLPPVVRAATPALLFGAAGDVSAATTPALPYALSFGVAANGSGVPFHTHNDGFAEVFHGTKRWLFYPTPPPRFDPNMTSSTWAATVLPTLSEREAPRECLLHPGDLLYFPAGTYHATINVGVSVFMSIFL